jgi:hypothetical protein
MPDVKLFLTKFQNHIAAAGLLAFSALLHSLLFLGGQNPFGYDTGFYRRYLIEPIASFPNTPVPGLGADALLPRILLDLLRIVHIPPDIALYGSHLFLFALAPTLLFFFLRSHLGYRGALIAGICLAASPIQYAAFGFMFFKNAFALDLLLGAFIALDREWFLAACALDIAIALSHKTTAIVYLATLGALFLFWRKERKRMLVHAGLVGLGLGAVAYPLIHQLSIALPVALFMDWQEYFWLSLPFGMVIAAGWPALRGTSVPFPLRAFAPVSIGFVLLRLPFFERIFIFSDVALAALAAFSFEHLLSKIELKKPSPQTAVLFGILSIAVGLFFGNVWSEVGSQTPLMADSDIARIESIGSSLPQDALVLTTSDEAPWYEGWTEAHVAAPGLLHDTHNLEAWIAFWNATSSEEKILFLNSFPQPLYISTLGDVSNLVGSVPSCVRSVAPYVWRDECAIEK